MLHREHVATEEQAKAICEEHNRNATGYFSKKCPATYTQVIVNNSFYKNIPFGYLVEYSTN